MRWSALQVTVYIRVVFLKIGEIDTLKENFMADAFIQARWREPALDGHASEVCMIVLINFDFQSRFIHPIIDQYQYLFRLIIVIVIMYNNWRACADFLQRRSRTQVLCARCVRYDVSSDRIALFMFCVMRHDSAKRHILGGSCAPRRGARTPKFELGRDFCAMHLPPSFIILCLLVRKLSC